MFKREVVKKTEVEKEREKKFALFNHVLALGCPQMIFPRCVSFTTTPIDPNIQPDITKNNFCKLLSFDLPWNLAK